MKKIFVFFAGLLIGLFITAAGIFLYLKQESKDGTEGKTTAFLSKEHMVNITGEVNPLPNLKIRGDQSKGTLSAFLTTQSISMREKRRIIPSSQIEIIGPKFPLKITIRVPSKDLTDPHPDGFLYLNLRYTTADHASPNYRALFDRARTDDVLVGGKKMPVTSEQLLSDTFPSNVDFGRAIVGVIFPPLPQSDCSSSKVLLAGKITPWPGSKFDWHKGKIAMVALSGTYVDGPGVMSPKEFDETVFHYQFLDFTGGTVTFSIPGKKLPRTNSFIRLLAVGCEDKQDLKECAMKAFPADRPNPHNLYPIFAKDYVMPVCGLNNFEGYIAENWTVISGPDNK